MPAAPLPADEAQRLASLLACNILDTPADERFDSITRMAARLCDVPIVLVSLIDERRQWFKSAVGLERGGETPRRRRRPPQPRDPEHVVGLLLRHLRVLDVRQLVDRLLGRPRPLTRPPVRPARAGTRPFSVR